MLLMPFTTYPPIHDQRYGEPQGWRGPAPSMYKGAFRITFILWVGGSKVIHYVQLEEATYSRPLETFKPQGRVEDEWWAMLCHLSHVVLSHHDIPRLARATYSVDGLLERR